MAYMNLTVQWHTVLLFCSLGSCSITSRLKHILFAQGLFKSQSIASTSQQVARRLIRATEAQLLSQRLHAASWYVYGKAYIDICKYVYIWALQGFLYPYFGAYVHNYHDSTCSPWVCG